MTREPGDLPSAVVTREHVGRGVLTEPSRRVRSYVLVRLRSQVTCHNVAPEVLPCAPSPSRHIVPRDSALFSSHRPSWFLSGLSVPPLLSRSRARRRT